MPFTNKLENVKVEEPKDDATAAAVIAAGGATTADVIAALVKKFPVVILGKSSCPFCLEAKCIFERQGVIAEAVWFLEREDTVGWHDVLKELTNQKTVPYVYVKGEFIGGCDDAKALEASGELQKKLQGVERSAEAPDATRYAAFTDADQVIRPLLYFPDLVDSWAVRCTGLMVAAIAIVSIPLRNHLAMQLTVLGLFIDFCLRFALGPGPSPLAQSAKVLVALLRWNKPPNLVQGWPKQFATFAGLCFSTLGATFYLVPVTGLNIAGAAVMATLAFFALLEGLFDFCVGCVVFSLAVRLGIVPGSVYASGVDSKPEMMYTWEYMNERQKLPPPTTVRYQYEADTTTSIDFVHKLEDQEDHERFDWHPIRHCEAAHFNMSLALMALAAAWKLASMEMFGFNITSRVWKVLLGVAFVNYVIWTALYLTKMIMYPKKVKKEWEDPVRGNGFAVWLITMQVLALLVVGDLWGAGTTVAKVLFWMSAPVQLALAIIRLGNSVVDRFDEELLDARWLIYPVGLFIGAAVGPIIDPVNHLEMAYLWFSLALLMWLVLFTLTFRKAVFSHISDERRRPVLAIWVAAPSAACVSWTILQSTEAGARVFAVDSFGKILFFIALSMFLILGWCVWRGFLGRSKFNFVTDWSYGFPMCALTLAGIMYQAAVKGHFTMGLVYTGLGLSSWVVAVLAVQTIGALVGGGVFVPAPKWGPLSVMRLTHEALRTFVPKLTYAAELLGRAPESREATASFLKLWRQFETVHDALSRNKDEVIFKTFDEYFPGIATDHCKEHELQRQKLGEWRSLCVELAVAEGTSKAKIASQLSQEIPEFLTEMLSHLRDEEARLQPIGRKIIPVGLQQKMLERMFNITPVTEWYVFMPFVINNLPMLPQRVKFIRCFTWVLPERAQLIGRMVALEVLPVAWQRLVEHVPEIIPKAARGWRRYY